MRAAGAAGLGGLAASCAWFDEQQKLDTGDRSKRAYTIDPAVTYLNHGSIGTIPRIVQQAQAKYLATCESNPWLYMWGGAWDEPREAVREKAARLLGCGADCIAINHNTTEGFNLLASGVPLGEGDEVLFSSLNHAGASVCWRHHAKQRGYTVRSFEIPLERVPNITADELVALYEESITERTRVLVMPHIDNVVGLRQPVREIVAVARRLGVEVIAVDGAQAVGVIPVDVSELGVDVYCTSPHKWLQAPKGLGLIYVRRELQQSLRPMWVTWGQDRWADSARRFEDYGTRNLPDLLALGNAIDFRLAAEFAATEAHLGETRARFRERVREDARLRWRSPQRYEDGGSLFAIEAVGADTAALGRAMWEQHGVVVRAFAAPALRTLRVSPNTMNDAADLERFFAALRA